MKKRILLLSAYDTLSHQKWRAQLTNGLPEYDWQVLTLPPRFFNYRVRTNALSWYYAQKSVFERTYDLVLATSLSDLTLLKALNPGLEKTPIWMYCHENQFAYPKSEREKHEHRLQVQTCFFFNCLCADHISFNSRWNQESALQGLDNLRQSWPERLPIESVQSIREKSSVLPVPIDDLKPIHASSEDKERLDLIWNHRWEYDKGPSRLLHFVEQLLQTPTSKLQRAVRVHIVGQQFRKHPDEFSLIHQRLDRSSNSRVSLGEWGFIADEKAYRELLASSDVVLSTAHHDFQGLSILEAVQQGCVPLLPNDLAYPEFFSNNYLYDTDQNDRTSSQNAVEKLIAWINTDLPRTPDIRELSAGVVLSEYDDRIRALTDKVT